MGARHEWWSAPPSSNLPLADELAGVFARMSGLLLSEETVETALGVLSALAQETVPELQRRRCLDHRPAAAPLLRVDRRRGCRRPTRLQYEFDEGPCLAAATDRELVRDATTSPRTGAGRAGPRPRSTSASGP